MVLSYQRPVRHALYSFYAPLSEPRGQLSTRILLYPAIVAGSDGGLYRWAGNRAGGREADYNFI